MVRLFRFLSVVAVAHLFYLSSIAQLSIGQSDTDRLKRASAGDATAMHLIGRAAAAEGKTVEAYAWFSLASVHGVETSEKSVLFNALNPAQLADATRRIEEIRSTHLRGLPEPAPKPAAPVVDARRPQEAKPVTPPAVAPAITQPAPDGQIETQRAQIAKLEADLSAARTETRTANAQSVEATAQLEAALAKATQGRDALSTENAALRQDKLRAEESLAQMRAKPVLDGQVESQKAQIAKLEADLSAARTETRTANAQSVEATAQLESALAKATQERETLSREVATLRQDRIRAEEARDQLRAELSTGRSKLEADLAVARTEARVAKTQAGESTTRHETALAQANQERDALSAEVTALRQEKLRAEDSLAQMRARPSLDGQVESLKTRNSKLEADLAVANSEARAAKTQAGESTTRHETALAQANQERDARSAEVTALRQEKLRAEDSLAQMRAKPASDAQVESQKAQIAKLESDLAAARSETSAAKEKVGELNTQLQAALAKPSQERPAPPAEIATLRQDRLRAEQARDQLRVEFAAARSKLEADLAAARNEARVAKAYAEKLEADLASARSESRSGGVQFGDSTSSLRAAPLRAPVAEAVDTPAPVLPRVHTVASGENLSGISQRYYGTPNRWDEIFNANRDVLNSPNQIALGTRLRIP